MPEGVTAVTDGEEIVAVVRALVEIEEPEPVEEDEETAEPERIGRIRKEGEAEGEQESPSSGGG